MSDKLKLSFYTNIPTPYQDDFFTALSAVTDFKAVFYDQSEKDRHWSLQEVSYNRKFLNNSFVARLIHFFSKDFHFSWQIFSVAKQEQADWIILGGNYFALNNLVASYILKNRNKKLAFFSEPVKTGSKISNAMKRIYLSYFMSRIDLIIGVGRKAEESYRYLGLTDKDFVNIPYNINVDLYDKNSMSQQKLIELRQELDLKDKFVIISSGSLIYRKGMDLVIDALNKLPGVWRAKIICLILGTGPELDSLKQKDIFNLVRFCDFKTKEELPYYFAISDLFLFCSRYDGWGLVINEAIASGLPIICSNQVGSSELLIQGKNAFVLDCNDSDLVSQSIIEILSNQKIAENMKNENLNLKKLTSSKYFSEKLVNYLNSFAA